MSRKHAVSANYFVWTNPSITAFILFGLFYLLPVSLFNPALLPQLPIVDMYMKYVEQYNMLIKFVFIISVYIHVIETLVAIALCNRHQLGFSATLKWTLSVAVNGVFSLKYLLNPQNNL
ncbi:uncharacterized protein LOC111713828 [Eurytemora carolleeae]|uniref:uncharacterized protein LOC111713828 n=1 Tax=Eurytemora carolleeae TaxID=1294199 RepID=UPI000C77796D|nr:uncharacterized protein LOC111713828 [Eurytemora carolleeae]|eukprot:XP_023344553.1 uncharacterized protein LOC111713828 [Eurytemora affinis]